MRGTMGSNRGATSWKEKVAHGLISIVIGEEDDVQCSG